MERKLFATIGRCLFTESCEKETMSNCSRRRRSVPIKLSHRVVMAPLGPRSCWRAHLSERHLRIDVGQQSPGEVKNTTCRQG
jgi:hypothetical protein